METSKLKKAITKIQKRTIQALLYISEDGFDLAKSPFFNCFKIVIYFLQLEGYVFSQYESKPLSLSENIYLSNYTQLSPLTFILLQIGDDALTQFFFYFIFCLHVIVYLSLIQMSLDSNIAKPNYIKKILNLFFINYQWVFVTPFQEISVGVMVCGKTAFIKTNQYSSDCSSEKSKILYIFGVLGTLFVSISGFLISYFFRNYQFFEKTFSRQFSYTNVLRILLHQLVIILYYINFPGIDYAKHAFQQLLAFSLIYDIIMNQPFGYSFESNFYSSAAFTHQYFLLLLSIWIFAPGVNDTFLFYTFLLILPLLIILSNQFQKRDQIEICNQFQLTIYNDRADKYLEEIYRTAEESDTNIESKILFIQILNHHIQLCKDPECSCMLNVQNFFNNNQVDYKQLNIWTTYVFQQCLRLSLFHKDYEIYEHLALKYVTFLAKYKNNPVNAYAILQAIMNNQQSQNIQIKGRKVQSSSFYFLNIQFILQKRNRNQFQNQNVHHSDQLKVLLKGHSVIDNVGTAIQTQIQSLSQLKQQFWEDYYNNKIQTFQILIERLKTITIQIKKIQDLMKILRNKQGKKSKMVFDCVSILNLELLFKICTSNNILEIFEIQHQISQILFIEQQELETFLNFHFQNQLCITLISNITSKKRGELWKPNQQLLEQYFNLSVSITHLNQLIPPFIAEIHDGIIENYIRRGYSLKMEQTNLIFALQGDCLIQPLQFTLGYFFPKFSQEFEFYLIAFFKKVESGFRTGSSEKSNIGYIYFDIHLNVLGINEVIASKLFESNTNKDLSKIELSYILPSVVESLVQQYHFMIERQISDFLDNDILTQKQQETFYVPRELKKIYSINQQCSFKNRVQQLQDIIDDITKSCPFNEMKQCQISYQLFSKIIPYQKGNLVLNKEFFFLKVQFLEEQDNKVEEKKDHKEYAKVLNEEKIQNTPNNSSLTSQSIDNGIMELGSQRSKSSSQTLLQQSNQFHNQLMNNKNKQISVLFSAANASFSLYLLSIVIIVSIIILNKFQIGNYCVTLQSHIVREISIMSGLVNAINNEQLFSNIKEVEVHINFDSKILVISDEDILLISQQLITYLSDWLTFNMQERDISSQISSNISYLNGIDVNLNQQNINNLLIFRQIILASTQNYEKQRNIKDLSIIIQNFPQLLGLLNNQTMSCFIDFDTKLGKSTDQTNQILICFYGLLFFIFISQLLLINKLFRQRKLILKLFTRADYKESMIESEKFSIIATSLRNQENVWLLRHMTVVLHLINQKGIRDDDDLPKQSDRGKSIKSEKTENFDNLKFKITISHQLSNLLSLLTIIGITMFTFIYIISFHVQIVNSSSSLDQYSFFSQNLQNFQYSYLSAYFNSQYHLLETLYTYSVQQNFLDLVYKQSLEQNTNLQNALTELNSNHYNSILMATNESDVSSILSLTDSERELLFQGYFCQASESICNTQTNRQIQFQQDLLSYYNRSVHQLLLQQGQVYYQNSDLFQMKDKQTIYQNIQKIITSQDYFLDNFWGFDIINTRFSESIVYLTEKMANNLQNSGNTMFLFAISLGIIYFFISSISLWLFGRYSRRQNMQIRQYLTQMPFSTILKKNISQQLKFID